MRSLTQLAGIVAIAAGAGLYAYSQHLDPPLPRAMGGMAAAEMTSTSPHNHEMAATACGWGVGFITLGSLMLIVPWVNVCVQNYRSPTAAAAN